MYRPHSIILRRRGTKGGPIYLIIRTAINEDDTLGPACGTSMVLVDAKQWFHTRYHETTNDNPDNQIGGCDAVCVSWYVYEYNGICKDEEPNGSSQFLKNTCFKHEINC